MGRLAKIAYVSREYVCRFGIAVEAEQSLQIILLYNWKLAKT